MYGWLRTHAKFGVTFFPEFVTIRRHFKRSAYMLAFRQMAEVTARKIFLPPSIPTDW